MPFHYLFLYSFGIILKGSASVHARKDHARVPQQDSVPIPRGYKDRVTLVGPELCGLPSGSSFGEMLMSHEHQTYNSTIIADELTHVLLIDEKLYARSFGAHKTEWENKVKFVNQSTLFGNLTPAIKNLLMENLKPREIQFGNRFVKQGAICNSLFFVCCGWGKVIADVRLSMTQYDAMKASSKVKVESSGRKTACCDRTETKTKKLDPSRPLSVIERRRHRQDYGYVAIETFLRQRETQVTTTGPNDVIGDIEIIMNLPTYCASVECMENLRVYELSKYNFHQIINQRCTQTYNLILKGVQAKLHYRAQRHKEIPLYSLLYEQASAPPVKERRHSRASSIPRPSLWAKKIVKLQTMVKLTGIARATEPPARIGDNSITAKTTATVDNDSKESKSR